MTLEQVVLILLVLFILLFQHIVSAIRKRLEELARQSGKPATAPTSSKAPVTSATRGERRGPARRKTPPALMAPPSVRRRTRSPVGNLGDVRRGIVLMTILGPCRAREAPEPHRP